MQFALVLHLEPPASLPDADVAEWWAAGAVPLIRAIRGSDRNRLGLSLSGPLLGWLADERPVGLAELRDAVAAGQIELLTSPFHAPVLSSIPADDATDQVLAHLMLVRRVADARPTGAWLPRQVWDPTVPRIFGRADVAWTVLDDAAIAAYALEKHVDPWGAWATEREGHPLVLLANDTGAAGLRGVASPDEMIVYLEGRASQGAEQLVVAADLGRRGAIDAADVAAWVGLIERLPAASFVSVRPSDIAAVPRGRVYLPSWAPDAASLPWERQLLRSPDADLLHKRMLRVSRQLVRLHKRVRRNDPDAPDPDAVIQARRYLHRAQGAAHYEPAGIAHPYLRHRAWRDLLRAEDIAERAAGTARRLAAEVLDAGLGAPMVWLRTPAVALLADPRRGGALSELAVFPAAINVVDPHVREGRGLHVAFVEHFLHPETPLASVHARANLPEAPAAVVSVERVADRGVHASFARDVHLADEEGPRRLVLSKAYGLRVDPRLDVVYELRNPGDGAVRSRFAVEIPLTVGAPPDRLRLHVGPHTCDASAAMEFPEAQELTVTGGAVHLRIGVQRPARLWVFPTPLGVTVFAEWPLEIWSQEATRLKIKVEALVAAHDDDDPVDDEPEPVGDPKVGDTLVLQRPRPHPEDQRVPAHHRVRAAPAPAKRADTLAAELGLVRPQRRYRPTPAPLYAPPRPRSRDDADGEE